MSQKTLKIVYKMFLFLILNFLIKLAMVIGTICSTAVLVPKLWIVNAFKSCADTAYYINSIPAWKGFV